MTGSIPTNASASCRMLEIMVQIFDEDRQISDGRIYDRGRGRSTIRGVLTNDSDRVR
jgi:hypothetical protein